MGWVCFIGDGREMVLAIASQRLDRYALQIIDGYYHA